MLMITTRHSHEAGVSTGSVIAIVALALSSVGFAALSVWALMQYNTQKTNVDGRIATAQAAAEKKQADADEVKFAEREKQPNREFIGPSDYGSLSFMYPKTWSVYVANAGGEGNDYEAYLNPASVPPVDDATRFALRVQILNQDYSNSLQEYQSYVEDGTLKTSVIKFGKETGTRLEGKFSDDIRGSAVMFKIRDKTAVLRTDADTFKADFNAIVKTLKFNQ